MTDEQAAFAMYILLQILHADGSYTVENSEYFKKVNKLYLKHAGIVLIQ